MRLRKVERGESAKERLLHGVVRLMSGYRLPDVVRTMRYRPQFLGGAQMAHTQAVLRGPSDWSIGERELMAAWVSRLNHCRF